MLPLPTRLDEIRAETARLLGSERKRASRRCDAIRADLGRLVEAEERARLAALAAPTASRVARGATSVEVIDYATGEAVMREVPLDKTIGPRASLEKIFQRARRLRRGEPVARTRLVAAEASVATLDAALAALAIAEDEPAVLAARAMGRLPSPKVTRHKPAQAPKPPFRTFRTALGDVLVGRGAARNEELTFRVAKPHHLWLHVRGTPGAHVVVPLKRDQSCASDLLVDAAHLAAHFSDARGERIVEVSYVARKFVRKPRGAPPGTVTMEREKVLSLRVDPARVEHLLTTEIDQNA